ncbi:hypothetical protein ACFVTC_33870 [Streptomyces sp. NPDC057950]|uniref:hypothetical protein n=1 Tax=Streptomyces sp. NPDC057950 TaxID=3346288 RepID=UPI0036F17C63
MSGDTAGGRPSPEESRKRQRPLKRARVGWPRALRELKDLLYEVYLAAGAPSLDEIAQLIAADDGLAGAPGRDTVRRVISDASVPPSQGDAVTVATVLARQAVWDAPDLAGRVRDLWVQARIAQGPGRPIGDLRGDIRLVLDGGLGVHPALDTDDARDKFGILPTYLPRDHDARLKTVVDAAIAGRSGIAVLVGGSSTGKTRALWEAVRGLPEGWRLWHPLSPTAPDAALAALPDIAPKTVVWLNEAQNYLVPAPLGEQVAAGLRELLNDPSRAPVLVLGTLWPEHWNTLNTTVQHVGARVLLSTHKIDVPKAFTPADLAALDIADDADPRLVQAARSAVDAEVTQYLAGVPYLMDRYRTAEGATRALIQCAMDARRLGAGLHLPLDWLAGAAPSYLTDTEYHALNADWLTKALAYTTEPCNGIPGILTPVNTSGPRNQRTRRRPDHSPQAPRYLLADYLDQHGRHRRSKKIPPIDFWTAAVTHAHPADLASLGHAAWARGLYRDATQLLKSATTHGNANAAVHLVSRLHTMYPGDDHPAQWAAAHVALNDPSAVTGLLRVLREVGADEQVSVLLARDPAAHVALNDPGAVTGLLRVLREVGADEQVSVLLARDPAAHGALNNLSAVADLLEALRECGADEQVTVLAERAATLAALSNPFAVAKLLWVLRECGADEQVTVLAERAATHTPLDTPRAVADLLEALREAGADEQVTVVAEQAAAHAPLNDLDAVTELLRVLREAGAGEQVAILLARDPAAHGALNNLHAVARLLWGLREAGADEQVTALAERAAAHAALDNPHAVTELLWGLREAGADEQVTALAERAAAHAALDNPHTVARLLRALREAGADEQVTALLARDPAKHTTLNDPHTVIELLYMLRRVGADEQVMALAERAAAHGALDNPGAVTRLLRALREAGADEYAAVLAERAAAHAALDSPHLVAKLLWALRGAGADEQVIVLLARDPATHAVLDHPGEVARLLWALQGAQAHEQIAALVARDPATHTAVDNPHAVALLIKELREAGAGEQVAVLAQRLPGAGHFGLFLTLGGNRERFRLGREPDGSAAPSWTWNDMD